jgi:hypothetical protein
MWHRSASAVNSKGLTDQQAQAREAELREKAQAIGDALAVCGAVGGIAATAAVHVSAAGLLAVAVGALACLALRVAVARVSMRRRARRLGLGGLPARRGGRARPELETAGRELPTRNATGGKFFVVAWAWGGLAVYFAAESAHAGGLEAFAVAAAAVVVFWVTTEIALRVTGLDHRLNIGLRADIERYQQSRWPQP